MTVVSIYSKMSFDDLSSKIISKQLYVKQLLELSKQLGEVFNEQEKLLKIALEKKDGEFSRKLYERMEVTHAQRNTTVERANRLNAVVAKMIEELDRR